MFVSKYAIFVKTEFVLERNNERKIELKKCSRTIN
jgi:hypothetical protein